MMSPDEDNEEEQEEVFEEAPAESDRITLPAQTPSAAEESEEEANSEFFGNRRRRAAAGERRSATTLWLISYSDFMTILFIFFMVMYGYAILEKQKKAAQGATISYDAFAKLMERFENKVGTENVEIKEDLNKITIQMKDNVLFASGSAEISENAKATMAELASSLKLVAGEVIVEGHTDNVPISGGRYRSNWELSAARAFSVIDALTTSGVPGKRLAAWGFGENRPLASNVSEVGRKQNRRIEVIVFKGA